MSASLQDRVIVLTGASSGIGRASALELARRGATLVLAARRDEALEDVAAECERLGGKALAVHTDVTSTSDVAELARRATEAFGRIDVWINNAGVYLQGKFEDIPPEDFRRVFETNFFGVVNGTRAIWRTFKERKHGLLINVASVASDSTMAYTSAYSPTKAAVRNFSDCLRMELHNEGLSDVHVCSVLPTAIDTPLFQQAADYAGKEVKPPDPVYPVEEAALAIANLVEKPQREVTVGRAAPAMMAFKRLAPRAYEKAMGKSADRNQFTDRPKALTSGNLYEPMPEYAVESGGWLPDGGNRGPSTGTVALLGLAAIAAVPALVAYARRN